MNKTITCLLCVIVLISFAPCSSQGGGNGRRVGLSGSVNTRIGISGIKNMKGSHTGGTVLGIAIFNNMILQPGPETRKKLRSSALHEIKEGIAQSSNGVTIRQAGDEIWVEIVRVQTRGGNDPLNINNPTQGGDTTGRVTGSAGSTGAASFTCTPGTFNGGFFVFFLNPTAGTCSLGPSGGGGGVGETEAFDGCSTVMQTDPAGDFRFVQVPAVATVVNPGISWSMPSGTTTNWTLKQTSTGKQWRINITTSGACGAGTVTINSVTRL